MGSAVSLCKLCLQLPSKEKQYKHIELVLATKSSSSLSEVIERVGLNEHTGGRREEGEGVRGGVKRNTVKAEME